MALYYNGAHIAPTQNVFYNNQASKNVYYNGALVWQKAEQLWPGTTWESGQSGSGSSAYVDGSFLVINGGTDGASGTWAKWFDAGPWNTLSITLSWTTLSYSILSCGVYTANWTDTLNTNAVQSQKWMDTVLNADGSHTGTYTFSLSGLSGGHYALIWLYGGSNHRNTQVGVGNVTLS